MEKFFKIVGIVVVAWIVLALIGKLVGFLISSVLWIALIAGGIYIVGAIAARGRRNQVGRR